jgi:hypothetical protein
MFVPVTADKIYYDIGYGYNELCSLPVKGGMVYFPARDINVSRISGLAVRAPGTQAGEDKFVGLNFDPSIFVSHDRAKPLLVVFWSAILTALAIVLYHRRARIDAAFRQDKSLCLFFLLSAWCGFVAWVNFPSSAFDSIQQQIAYTGYSDYTFSALFVFFFHSSYLLTGDGTAGILIVQAVCMAGIFFCNFKTLILVHSNKAALIMTVLCAVSPVVFHILGLAEQRELTACLAVLSVSLIVEWFICDTKKTLWKPATAIMLALAACMMRSDFAGYLMTVAAFVALRFAGQSGCLKAAAVPASLPVTMMQFTPRLLRKVVKTAIAATLSAGLLAAGLGPATDSFVNPEAAKFMRDTRVMTFFTTNFGYMYTDNLLSSEEKNAITKIGYDIEQCKRTWDGVSYPSLFHCIPSISNFSIVTPVFRPIVKRIFLDDPLRYLHYRSHFVQNMLKFMINPCIYWRYRDNYKDILYYLKEGIDEIQGNWNLRNRFTMQHIPRYSAVKSLFLRYAKNNRIWFFYLLLLFSLSVAIFFSVRRMNKKSSIRVCVCFIALTFLGPLCKFATIALLASFLDAAYLMDIMLFVICALPIFIAVAPAIAKQLSYQQ